MKSSKFGEEQIAYALRQAESGTAVADVCRQIGVSEATCYVWNKKFAYLGVSELRRMRRLEDENRRLESLVADLTLDTHMLSEALRKKTAAGASSRARRLIPVDLRDQHRARVRPGPVLSCCLLRAKPGEGPDAAPPAHQGPSARAAALRLPAHPRAAR